jgi:hypothetical protein
MKEARNYREYKQNGGAVVEKRQNVAVVVVVGGLKVQRIVT